MNIGIGIDLLDLAMTVLYTQRRCDTREARMIEVTHNFVEQLSEGRSQTKLWLAFTFCLAQTRTQVLQYLSLQDLYRHPRGSRGRTYCTYIHTYKCRVKYNVSNVVIFS